MEHIVTKDIYKKLGKKLDNLSVRAPYNEAFYAILKELCSIEEADILIKMPYRLSSLDRVAKITRCEKSRLRKILESLCEKAMVLDVYVKGSYYYQPAPIYIGMFDISMMASEESLDIKKLSRFVYEYLHEYFGDNSFYAANFGHGEQVSFARTLPYEEAISVTDGVEILDYEKATSLVKESNKFAIGLCSCRRGKENLGKKTCDVPLETCSSFGGGADYSIRHGFAKEVSKSEMLENITRSKELGLVINVDNAQRNISFMCHCCKCCCDMLLGITKHGYPNTIVSSAYIAEVEESKCRNYERCYEVCPVNCIERVPVESPTSNKKTKPKIDESRCIGCGICAVKCPAGAIKMVKRKQRVIHPATIYEQRMLQCLERGALQNQLFDNPQSITQKAMRAVVGGFLRLPPVKKALMSDMLRSTFLRLLMRFEKVIRR